MFFVLKSDITVLEALGYSRWGLRSFLPRWSS